MHDETATPAGQSASSRSERAEAPPLPGGRDVRRALRIYVAGRSRFWSADEKRAAAGEGPAPSEPDSSAIAESERDARVGVPVPETMLGRNVMAEGAAPPVFFSSHFLNQDLRGMRSGRYKIIENRRTGAWEFYDLVADPEEKSPLDPATHEAWPAVKADFDRTMMLYGESPGGSERREPPVLDEETREQLKSLGYVN